MRASEILIRRHLDAFNAGDLEALLAGMTPDAIWTTADHRVPEGGMREFFSQAMTQLLPQLELRRVIGDGTRTDGRAVIAAELRETWQHAGSAKTAELIGVFDLMNGKIAAGRIYREGSADP